MTNLNEDAEFEELLEYIKSVRGFDFTGYKRSSLMRRVDRRLQTLNIERYSDYLDYLEVHPEEFRHLFNTILINVTSFFRDRSAWEYIGNELIPHILACKQPGQPIRVWSAGCASGEEAYTIAMLLAQIIGMESFGDRVKIYATDVDEDALNQARLGIYAARELEGLLPQEQALFFDRSEDRYSFRKDLRRSLIFGRHDLIQDAPISKIDLLVCRNALMYFNAETQAKILARFHFALCDQGFLFLGKAEMLLNHANLFIPINLKRRVFIKVAQIKPRDRLFAMTPVVNEEISHFPDYGRLRDVAFDKSPLARIVTDANGALALVNEQARMLFNISSRDIGCPLQDLEISYRPVELRRWIEQAYRERRAINLSGIEWQLSEELLHFDVQVAPLVDTDNRILGASINFIDITRYQRLQEELERSNQELEMAYEELETTNEELQSSNEELETTNEELHSTNEELETMNEELQSTNEELQTLNEELQRRSEELNQSNAFLESILRSLKGAVVVVDRDLYVQIWSYKAEDLWGVRTEEAIVQNFLNLDIGLPVEQLRQPIRACLSSSDGNALEVVLEAINRRGRAIQCRVTCTPLVGSQGQIKGIILLMEEQDR